jgi:hypothetical protein
MMKYRNYWLYSAGCLVVWGIVLGVVASKGDHSRTDNVLLVFGGFAVAWISGTIARFIYPPPRRWTDRRPPAA